MYITCLLRGPSTVASHSRLPRSPSTAHLQHRSIIPSRETIDDVASTEALHEPVGRLVARSTILSIELVHFGSHGSSRPDAGGGDGLVSLRSICAITTQILTRCRLPGSRPLPSPPGSPSLVYISASGSKSENYWSAT